MSRFPSFWRNRPRKSSSKRKFQHCRGTLSKPPANLAWGGIHSSREDQHEAQVPEMVQKPGVAANAVQHILRPSKNQGLHNRAFGAMPLSRGVHPRPEENPQSTCRASTASS